MADRVAARVEIHDALMREVRSGMLSGPLGREFAALAQADRDQRRERTAQRRAAREDREDRAAKQREVLARLREFAAELSYELRIPGAHSDGPTYDKLLEYREEEGRPFARDSRSLRERLRHDLFAEFEDAARLPTPAQMKRAAANIILEQIVRRVEQGGFDIRIKPNVQRYRRWKIAHGYDSRTGVRTGEWLAALRSRGRVTVTM